MSLRRRTSHPHNIFHGYYRARAIILFRYDVEGKTWTEFRRIAAVDPKWCFLNGSLYVFEYSSNTTDNYHQPKEVSVTIGRCQCA